MNDLILASFLEEQEREAMELAAASDLFDLVPIGPRPRRHYGARFRCKGLVDHDGTIVEADEFHVEIRFPLHYLRGAEPPEVLRLVAPMEVFHPNVLFPFICPGRLTTSTTLTDIVHQTYEILSFQKVTMDESDALNRLACSWARENQDRFPTDARPLRRRRDAAEQPLRAEAK